MLARRACGQLVLVEVDVVVARDRQLEDATQQVPLAAPRVIERLDSDVGPRGDLRDGRGAVAVLGELVAGRQQQPAPCLTPGRLARLPLPADPAAFCRSVIAILTPILWTFTLMLAKHGTLMAWFRASL